MIDYTGKYGLNLDVHSKETIRIALKSAVQDICKIQDKYEEDEGDFTKDSDWLFLNSFITACHKKLKKSQ